MRIAFVGDLHASDTTPQSRIDDYPRAILRKMDGIRELRYKWNFDAIVFLGDIFHSKRSARVSDWLRQQLMEQFSSMDTTNYVVPGNHDMGPRGLDSLDHQPLGTLAVGGMVQLLIEPVVFEVGSDKALLIPRPYSVEGDADPNYYTPTEEELALVAGNIPVVMVAHGSLLPAGEERPYPTVNVDKIPGVEKLDALVSGHIHENLGIHQLPGGGYFTNPGSVGRVARTQANMARVVSLFLLEFNKPTLDTRIQGQFLTIPNVAPATEVFAKVEEAKEEGPNDELKKFVGALAGGLQLSSMSLSEVIAQVDTENDEVRKLMLKYLEEVDA